MQVFLGKRKVTVDPARAIGKGGEADVYQIDGQRQGDLALKLWKAPGHPDLAGQPAEQAAAAARLALQQEKLRRFPSGLPPQVVAPRELATDRAGRVVGYSMPLIAPAEPLLRLSDRSFREGRVGQDAVVALLRELRRTLEAVHQAGAVVADLNDRNILCQGPWQGPADLASQAGQAGQPGAAAAPAASACHLIDVDSWQYGGFPGSAFSERFLDPLLCSTGALVPTRPPEPSSDWYAFAVLLMQSLLYVGPYGGVHRPARPSQAVPAPQRPLRRLTVFRPEVRYPRPALPYDLLPEELLDELQAIFERDRRGPFPARLLDDLRFRRCDGCGAEHARRRCPRCQKGPRVVTVTGAVRCAVALRTRGLILCASAEGGELRWLVHEDGALRREDGAPLGPLALTPDQRFAIDGADSWIGQGARLLRLTGGRGAPPRREVFSVDVVAGRSSFAGPFHCAGGRLLQVGPLGPERVGDVLEGQTRLWADPALRRGLGLYRAGALTMAFLFDGRRRALRDGVAVPPMRGELLSAGCHFSGDRTWFYFTAQEGPRAVTHLCLLGPDGAVLSACSDEPWLAQLAGACAAGPCLLVPSDEGVLRAEADAGAGTIQITRGFPATAPFVDGGCALLATRGGLAVVAEHEIRVLQLQ